MERIGVADTISDVCMDFGIDGILGTGCFFLRFCSFA